jgi:steroid delta-isomerase-like uncharacterized protein
MDNSADSKSVWLRYIEAWNEHNVDNILAFVADDFVYDEVPMTMHKPIRGKEEFKRYLSRVFRTIPDLHIDIVSLDVGGDFGFSESVMTGTLKIGNNILNVKRKIHSKVACRFDTANGKLIRENLYWDKGNTLKQLGVIASLMGVTIKPAWKPQQRN